MKYSKIQADIIKKYKVDICDGTKCNNDWHRTHAHVKERRVCKWKAANSAQSTFTLLHEVGHLETTKSHMRRCEEEYYATMWAIEKCKEYDMNLPKKIIEDYQAYINMEHERGIKHGGKLPPLEKLQLK